MIEMKKMKKIFSLALVALFAVVLLTACGGGDGNGIADDLVGTWEWDEERSFIYTFNADGTGLRGMPAFDMAEDFEWSIVSGNLHIELDEEGLFGLDSERWDVTIENNVLTLHSRQDRSAIYSYIRQ